ncbi:protein kinase [Stutzerimonas frequens]|uniref:Bifunctional protein-serine/threonine kinase/phosphatase n=1 Tax=Stutzerimonas frequens TaxID=2968969 RepID=A0ABX6XR96_9GAMM|nr:bifunctional protein-serine/threonine kinase/phosphatase [Stutzerimonas frequens]MCQ4303286.1 bifunctional protein-serine/threonine kinase/phosphatase [Stutzerimonas frequens]PNF49145.1 protein kinase [Stutzerimonas frequens]QPT16565.1 bifunctional protein-serine/threonine kinase/phosphatase [Stutzerimonas frequens]
MPSQLAISLGQHSDRGRKPANQDFHGACVPADAQLASKGIAIALADGISSSEVSHVASETAVASFLSDYFCTSDAWSVKQSAQRVLVAINSWLHAQTRHSPHRYDRDRGYVCTFSALVLKSASAHLFHIGDARIYRLRDGGLEQLTEDHRVRVSADTSYLGRALGIDRHLEIDYRTLPLAVGDLFLLATDGVYEHIGARDAAQLVAEHGDDLDLAARRIVERALANGSDDNLTAQLVRIDSLPEQAVDDVQRQLGELALPPLLEPRMQFDGYRIVRDLHISSRSHVHLAVDEASGATVVLKTPSMDLRGDAAYLERFLLEEWIARRLDNPHVVKACPPPRQRRYLYTVSEFIDGQTLAQWMLDHPLPDLETVRGIVEQIARGLRAFHRLEMLHQDLRPQNLMIDATGTLKIIDFGSTRVAGLTERNAPGTQDNLLGTAAYTAPEYFLGEAGTPRSDQYSLAVIAYQLLSGRLPYGADVARARTTAAQKRLCYQPLRHAQRDIPAWIDEVLGKALHPDPARRYAELSEFVFELRQPNPAFLNRARPPLLERNPLLFWKGLSLLLAGTVVALLLR